MTGDAIERTSEELEYVIPMTEEQQKFERIDRQIERHREELIQERDEFHWCDFQPFEFYLHFHMIEYDERAGKHYIRGHARGVEESDEFGFSGPFKEFQWDEVKLPLTTEFHNLLMDFAGYYDLKGDLNKFINQTFNVCYHGIFDYDDPHKGKVRIYNFYIELVDEEGRRVTLESLEARANGEK